MSMSKIMFESFFDFQDSRGGRTSVGVGSEKVIHRLFTKAGLKNWRGIADVESEARGNRTSAHNMRRILVVEDDDAMCKHLQDLLVYFGYEVRIAGNGNLGLSALKEWEPDLVILDVFMPEKDGFETLLEIRRDYPKMRVLVISGKEHLIYGKSIKFAEKLGADSTLVKPFTTKQLEGCLQAMTPRPKDAPRAQAPQ
jgi:CheY-like chemotaxis protein